MRQNAQRPGHAQRRTVNIQDDAAPEASADVFSHAQPVDSPDVQEVHEEAIRDHD